MFTIFWRTIRDRKWSIIIYTLMSVLFTWMYVGMFPSFSGKVEEFNKLLEAYPESMMKALGIEEASLMFSSIERFLAVENFSMIWPIMAIAFLVAWGGSQIAGEIEKGTIEMLISQPISRLKLFFAKYFSGVFALLIFTFVSIYCVIPLAKLYDVSYQAKGYLYLSIISFLFGLAVYSISIFFSTVFSEKGKAYFLSAGMMVLMYVAQIVANLKESLANFKYATFFYYYDYNQALFNFQIDGLSILVFLGVSIFFTTLAAFWFSRRDIAI